VAAGEPASRSHVPKLASFEQALGFGYDRPMNGRALYIAAYDVAVADCELGIAG
jgi:hypothetical protein